MLSSDTSFCKKLHLGEIARIVLPTDWAMCEMLWYGMVLVTHPHGYPHAMHIFCGHGEWEWQCPDFLLPFPARVFMWTTAKTLSERDVSVSTSAFIPWSGQMGARQMKTRHAACRCLCVIHNVSSSRVD